MCLIERRKINERVNNFYFKIYIDNIGLCLQKPVLAGLPQDKIQIATYKSFKLSQSIVRCTVTSDANYLFGKNDLGRTS